MGAFVEKKRPPLCDLVALFHRICKEFLSEYKKLYGEWGLYWVLPLLYVLKYLAVVHSAEPGVNVGPIP